MTTAPVVDERTHFAALKTLLSTPLNGHVYEYGSVPGDQNNPVAAERTKPMPPIFALLSVERRYVESPRAVASRSGWRITVRAVGTTPAEARWALLRATDALEGRRLSIGGQTSTPVAHESSQAIELDDGRFSGLQVMTYAL